MDKDRYDPQNSDPEDDSEIWPAGLLAKHATGAGRNWRNSGSANHGSPGARGRRARPRAGQSRLIRRRAPHDTGRRGIRSTARGRGGRAQRLGCPVQNAAV
jgi:hypothetical protein